MTLKPNIVTPAFGASTSGDAPYTEEAPCMGDGNLNAADANLMSADSNGFSFLENLDGWEEAESETAK